MELQLNPETNFYSDYGIYHIPFWRTAWFWWSSVIFIVFILGIIFYFVGKKVYKWYSQKNLTSWAQALQELKNLEQQRELGAEHAQIYINMINVIKIYLQKRFSIPLEHQTPQEMLTSIASLNLENEVKKKLHQLFTDASVFLFAPNQNDFTNIVECIASSRECVEKTIPQEK